jgi:hypothetical protein
MSRHFAILTIVLRDKYLAFVIRIHETYNYPSSNRGLATLALGLDVTGFSFLAKVGCGRLAYERD